MTQVLNFNEEWMFKIGEHQEAINSEFSVETWEKVTLPHCFNATDIQPGKKKSKYKTILAFMGREKNPGYYRGPTYYHKRFIMSEESKNKRIFIKFGAVSTLADVYVNGKHLTTHYNAFAAFTVEITEVIKAPGLENIIVIKADNTKFKNIPPLSGDFPIMGGIYRNVELLIKEKTCISPLDYGSEGVYITQTDVTLLKAQLDYKIVISSTESTQSHLIIESMLLDQEGVTVAEIRKDILNKKSENFIDMTLTVDKPHLWHGREDPYLYTSVTRVLQDGKELDCIKIPIGLRYYRFDPEEGFFLNDKPYFIYGVAKHQDKKEKGWALTKEDLELDHQLIYDTGARGLRLSHYQHPQYIYNLCDKSGILIWTEIPIVNAVRFNKEFLQHASTALIELIRQNYNHPSVILWGIFNELGFFQLRDASKVIEKLNKLAHQEDPIRPTTSAAIGQAYFRRKLHRITDTLAINVYPGWYYGKPEDVMKYMKRFNNLRKKGGIGVSEYGAGGAITQHDQSNLKENITAYGKPHPEEYQSYVHENIYPIMRKTSYIWGTFIWNMFDFAVPFRDEGDTPSLNDKGLVTYDRKTKKDVYYYYQSQWSDIPFIHLNSKRHTIRLENITPIRVYSNQERIFLWVNNQFLGDIPKVGSGCFQIKNINLNHGENQIRIANAKENPNIEDQCCWVSKNYRLKIIN